MTVSSHIVTRLRAVTRGSGALACAVVVVALIELTSIASSTRSDAKVTFGFAGGGAFPFDLALPARLTIVALAVMSLVAAALLLTPVAGHHFVRHLVGLVVGAALAASVLCWASADGSTDVVGLLQSTVANAEPLILGALGGVLCERAGIINVAIEGQLLCGAFAAALVGSVTTIWLGLAAAAGAGVIVAALLAVFAIRYAVNQVVLGVVLNILALGVTNFLYDRIMANNQDGFNSASVFPALPVPVLSKIPILGPVLFDGNVILYLTIVAVVLVQLLLFRTRWGLRARSTGEHPLAAETVGVNVRHVRWQAVLLGGVVAGVGGAYLTIGSVGSFVANISAGKGFIALAAVIVGRWTPFGAVGAALIFGFAYAFQSLISILGAPVPSEVLLMVPYALTLAVAAGFVGRASPPLASGQPYVRS